MRNTWEINNYGQITTRTEIQVIHQPDVNYPNRLCNANCINLSSVTNKAYLAGSGTDRKMFYNFQLYDVNANPCIGGGSTSGAGHLKPSLQIIDEVTPWIRHNLKIDAPESDPALVVVNLVLQARQHRQRVAHMAALANLLAA